MSLEVLRADGVRMDYASGRSTMLSVLDITTIEFRDGELTCILGPTGCGKTTFLNILARAERATHGTVTTRPSLQPTIAYMFQDDLLLPWRTVSDNILVGLEARGMSASEGVVTQWIERLGLRGFDAAYPSMLSVGMRQRVALARTLVLDAELVLLDEPLSSQDFSSRIMLEDILRSLLRRKGRVSIVVTHNIEEAVVLADRIVVLSGRPAKVIADVRPSGIPDNNRSIAARRSAGFGDAVQQVAAALTRGGEC